MTAEAFDVGDAVGGLLAGAKRGSADIDGVGAMVDGDHAYLGILGGREQFYLLRIHAAKLRNFGIIPNNLLFLQVIFICNESQRQGHIVFTHRCRLVSLPDTASHGPLQIQEAIWCYGGAAQAPTDGTAVA